MKIGILALQGAFFEHAEMCKRLGVAVTEIRQLSDFADDLDGLILPGGESTVIGKLLRDLGLTDPIRERIKNGMPVLGTCAGLILLANKLSNDPETYLGTMDMTVRRNAYGRQLGSFETSSTFLSLGKYPMIFIRAPYIESVGDRCSVLASVDGHIVAARQGYQLVTAFHPELTADKRVHTYFVGMIRESKLKR